MNSHVLKVMAVNRNVKWQNYKHTFLKYISENSTGIDDRKKISILLHFAGDHCRQLYNNVLEFNEDEDNETLATVLEKFDYHFACESNVSYHRHLFFSRKQRHGEMSDDYLQTLNWLIEYCDFGTLKESLVRDRFISGIRDKDIRKMLLKLNDIDLDLALKICNENSVKVELETENINNGTTRNAEYMNERRISDLQQIMNDYRAEYNEVEKFDGTTVKVEIDSDKSMDSNEFPLEQLISYNMDIIPRSSLEKSTSSSSEKPSDNSSNSNSKEPNKKPHIKKPLNAFMIYMEEMRAKAVAECTLKEQSSAINQVLGRRWHSLSPEEQAKYYEKAWQERQLHKQLYPGWSATDNYSYGSKKKKWRNDLSPIKLRGKKLRKCRANYGIDLQNQWCKPCRQKQKCERNMEALAAATGTVPVPMATPQSPCSDENNKLEEFSDASSDREADTPLNSVSSPGDLSTL